MSDEQKPFCSLLKAHCSLLPLELQSRFPRGIRQRLNATVIQISAAIEYDLGNALRLGSLGNGFADRFGRGDVAARAAIFLLPFGGAGGD